MGSCRSSQRRLSRSSAYQASASSSSDRASCFSSAASASAMSRRVVDGSSSSGTSAASRSAAASQSQSSTQQRQRPRPGVAAAGREREQQSVDRAGLQERATRGRVEHELVDHEIAPTRMNPRDRAGVERCGRNGRSADRAARAGLVRERPRRMAAHGGGQLALGHRARAARRAARQERAVLGRKGAERLGHRRRRLADLGRRSASRARPRPGARGGPAAGACRRRSGGSARA